MRRKLVLCLCAGVPLSFYLWTLSGASYWLDGGEFVASAIDLDIAHPPGHPLTALYGKIFSLLPFGSLAARLALGQSVAAAASALWLFRAAEHGAHAFGVRAPRIVEPLALLAAFLGVFGDAIWFQAIRPEVYALQVALLCLAMERMAGYASGDPGDRRALYAAALALGLGLANHHLMAFFLFPALGVLAFTASRRRGARPTLFCFAFGLLGLLVYAYLPLRAAQDPPANLGDPSSFARLFWVVSARVYARGMGRAYPQPLGERFLDVGVVLSEQLLFVFVPLALLGAYALLRGPATRRLGGFWLLAALPVLCIRPWLGSVRGNPDALAYLGGGCCAVAVLASAGVAALLSVAAGDRPPRRRRVEFALWLALGFVLGFDAKVRAPRLSLADFVATDLLDEYRQRALPPRSVLIAGTPALVFRAFELRASEASRPDLTLVPLPFLRYPGVADALVRRSPDLRELVASFLQHESIDPQALARLAQRRPVMLELESHLAPSAYGALLPAGLLYAPVAPRAAELMSHRAHALQERLYARIDAELGRGVHEVETARQLLWLHYMDALYWASRGERAFAERALAQARALFPDDAQLRALAGALARLPAGGALDVRPLLEFDAHE